MTDATRYEAQIARCKELARKAKSEDDRKKWLEMAEFWVLRSNALSESDDQPDEPTTGIVKI
jgi:hypothetical protein